jgi:hypothetical protein
MKSIQIKNRCITIGLLMTVAFLLCCFTLDVKAADNQGVDWKSITFGQSTSSTDNSILVDAAAQSVTITAGTKDGNTKGGKVTGSHDGIAFYYVDVPSTKNFELSAKVKVNFFAKATPDNQEAFGIMARDAIGKDQDATVFPSNMVLVGGYRGNIQSVFRNNVKDASGAGAAMEDVFKFGDRPANDGIATLMLKLRKTNTGYHVTVDNSPEKIYYRPKQLEVLDPGHVYVGFFAARVASITVSEITFKTSDVANDPPGVPEPPKPVAGQINVLSPSTTSLTGYNLAVSINAKGNLDINLNGTRIYSAVINGAETVVKDVTLTTEKNTFEMAFTPDIPGSPTVNLKYMVTFKTYGKPGQPLYVSPEGQSTATGTLKDPIDIYSAIQYSQPGQIIYVRNGVYNLTVPLLIEKGNNGTAAKLKVLSAYAKEKPVFDFGKKSEGLIINGDHWKIYGIDITNASSRGCWISGNHNIIEMDNFYSNGDTGLQISALSTEKRANWPSNNLILNCTSYDNRDKSENNADGFAAKLACGEGNSFKGCISRNNCDDGFDLYSKLESGPIGAITIVNCIAYSNGVLTNGTQTKGDGNGFKLGGEGLAVKHVLRNSLAFHNKSAGVTSNSDPAIIVENTTSVDNGTLNYEFSYYPTATPQFSAKNNISFCTEAGTADNIPAGLNTADNYFNNGTTSVNSNGKKVATSDFKNTIAPAAFARKADGTIAVNDYMMLVPNSTLGSGFNIKNFAK